MRVLIRSRDARSVFTLCPRGNGPSSFRIFESLEHRSIPVYIHDDDLILPMQQELDWSEFCVLISQEDLVHLKDILLSFSQKQVCHCACAACV